MKGPFVNDGEKLYSCSYNGKHCDDRQPDIYKTTSLTYGSNERPTTTIKKDNVGENENVTEEDAQKQKQILGGSTDTQVPKEDTTNPDGSTNKQVPKVDDPKPKPNPDGSTIKQVPKVDGPKPKQNPDGSTTNKNGIITF